MVRRFLPLLSRAEEIPRPPWRGVIHQRDSQSGSDPASGSEQRCCAAARVAHTFGRVALRLFRPEEEALLFDGKGRARPHEERRRACDAAPCSLLIFLLGWRVDLQLILRDCCRPACVPATPPPPSVAKSV
jgi:hypothetical protein